VTDEARKRTQEMLIKKGLIVTKGEEIHLAIKFEDTKKVIALMLFLKNEVNLKEAYENLVYITLALLNKYNDFTTDELDYLAAMALANSVEWTKFIKDRHSKKVKTLQFQTLLTSLFTAIVD
jgi:hypothetical protein